jgi:hypothetical protein
LFLCLSFCLIICILFHLYLWINIIFFGHYRIFFIVDCSACSCSIQETYASNRTFILFHMWVFNILCFAYLTFYIYIFLTSYTTITIIIFLINLNIFIEFFIWVQEFFCYWDCWTLFLYTLYILRGLDGYIFFYFFIWNHFR